MRSMVGRRKVIASRHKRPISPHRDLEPATDRLRQGWRHVPVQGLSPHRSGAPAGHDVRDARVHTPLPAACPATRLPSHPSLRPARQRHPQGQHRSRPRAPGRISSGGTCQTGGTARFALPMSLLRRPHAHHRDLCARKPAACAAANVHVSRDGTVVTRHGLIASYAAVRSLRPETRCVPRVHDRAISDEASSHETAEQPISPDIPRAKPKQDAPKEPPKCTLARA